MDSPELQTSLQNSSSKFLTTSLITSSHLLPNFQNLQLTAPLTSYVKGERIRRNITEGQAGIPIHLQLQFVDIKTCLRVPALFVDIWSANGTGGYSGAEPLPALGSLRVAGLNTTFLRGVQITDEHGVVSFDYIVPGH